jgi:hypothetical protein
MEEYLQVAPLLSGRSPIHFGGRLGLYSHLYSKDHARGISNLILINKPLWKYHPLARMLCRDRLRSKLI